MEARKESFCPVLWKSNGGKLDEKNNPIISNRRALIRGLCTRPYDCKTCPLLQYELQLVPSEYLLWVCPDCISTVFQESKLHNIPITVPGFYTEGDCEFPRCSRQEGARFSPLLQLVIGDLRR